MRRTPEQHSASISEDLALSTCLQEALISKRKQVAPKVQGGHPVLVQCCLILVFECELEQPAWHGRCLKNNGVENIPWPKSRPSYGLFWFCPCKTGISSIAYVVKMPPTISSWIYGCSQIV